MEQRRIGVHTARLCLLALLPLLGCASSPEVYRLADRYYLEQQIEFPDPGPQIEQGRPIGLLDGLNHRVLSLPAKLLLWNWELLDHKLPEGNRVILEHYLELNDLRSVKVRHNQYTPGGEFRRLTQNSAVGAGYRYTLGLLSWLRYTLLPDRLFAGFPLIGGGDHFNPFTNTINVYSSDVAVLLHEAGHAKDYVQHEMKGTSFVLPRYLPGIDLLQEGRASNDAIRYLHCIRDNENELRAYRTLIPAYSTYVAGYFEGSLEVTMPILLVGHIGARIQANRREREMLAVAEGGLRGFSSTDFLPPWCVPITPQEGEQGSEALHALKPPPDIGSGSLIDRTQGGNSSWGIGTED
jgi:hypothetical protein